MKIAYLGNYKFPWCSEEHFCKTLEDMGHEIVRLQEDEVSIDQIVETANQCHLFGWTRTYGMLQGDGFQMLERINVPTFSVHLDYYFNISRQSQMERDAFWFTDYVFQPDGDHLEEFKQMGINAFWSPPAVFKGGAYMVDLPKEKDLIFVGTGEGYHGEWPWRSELVRGLAQRYPQFERYPQGDAVREDDLNRLYGSTKIAIGDSIMADTNKTYTTDRIFETTGRGGFIIYPRIDWLVEIFGDNLATYQVGNWEDLMGKIDFYLHHENLREEMRLACHKITKRDHTYHQRFQVILDTMLSSGVGRFP